MKNKKYGLEMTYPEIFTIFILSVNEYGSLYNTLKKIDTNKKGFLENATDLELFMRLDAITDICHKYYDLLKANIKDIEEIDKRIYIGIQAALLSFEQLSGATAGLLAGFIGSTTFKEHEKNDTSITELLTSLGIETENEKK